MKTVSGSSQKRALKNYRKRLKRRGMARFEVLGLDQDRELIRSLARCLAENDSAASQIRAAVKQTVTGGSALKGNIFSALRRSPLVGTELNLVRAVSGGRGIAL